MSPRNPVAASASEWSDPSGMLAAKRRKNYSVLPTQVSRAPIGASPAKFPLHPVQPVAASASEWSRPRAPLGAFQAPTALRFFAPLCGQKFRALGLFLLASISAHAASAPLPPDQIEFFETKIRPILAESCYKCHSVAEGKSKGSLTLDTRDALLKGGATGPALVAGDPEKSLLIQAVRYTDEDLQMPPSKDGAGGKLSPEKIAALEHWVRLGAPDPRTAAAQPASLDMARARQHWAFQPLPPLAPRPSPLAIDAAVLAKLTAAKLTPASAADSRTLLRRVTYDLTGLPPTPAEAEAFLADRSPDAYARTVDRLLASPRYGERWGRFWLDVARYADTKGYLAGNEERRYAFSHTYRDYVIRAFNDDLPFDRFIAEQLAADQLSLGADQSPLAALGFLTLGRRFLNNQNDIIDDRIDVVTRALLGLTVPCPRCHDHKFDPIPTRDYYALHGMFASSEEPAEKPLLAKLDETAPTYRAFLAKRADLEAKIEAKKHELVDTFLADQRKKTGDYLLGAHDATQLPPGEKFDLFAGTRKLNPEILKRWQKYLADHSTDPLLAPWLAFLRSAELQPALSVHPALTSPSSSPDGPNAPRATPTDLLAHLELPAESLATTHSTLLAALEEKPPASLQDLAALYNRVFTDAEKTPPSSALLSAPDAPAALGFDETAKMLKRQIDDKVSGFRREIEALNWTEPGAPLRAMALVDKPKPHNSPIFLRGNPANKGPEAPRRFLEVLSPLENRKSEIENPNSSGRLELARAITGPAAPLTARVFVNRVWGWHFGQPLVRTPSDFGVRTESPVQRDVLDALAATFVAEGWSLKKLQRTIVLSATYRQSDTETPAAAAADPDNQLLHRFAPRRLEFEALRDTLLAVSGRLDLTPGGLPDDLTKEPFTRRRTVYGFIDRQNLPGMFRTFDFPNPDTSSAQRFATTVPQQALFLMNSPFAQEQARQLVQRPELATARSDPEKIRALYRLLYQRAPAPDELTLARDFLRTQTTARNSQLATRNSQLTAPPGWHYGTGAFDAGKNRVRDFTPLTFRKTGEGKNKNQDTRISSSEKFPDPTTGPLSHTPVGGHPGNTLERAAILRWIAPADGVIQIEATLGHATDKGDGVHAHLVSAQAGSLGEWTVHNSKAETKFTDLRVTAGETLDFLVDCRTTANSDNYTWSPKITFNADSDSSQRIWDAKRDFGTVEKIPVPLTPLEELAQVLLLSNELAFVD